MEGIFLGSSLLAAFVAGSVALFAPCCIVVMFPAYLAAAVRNNRWRLVPLTFVFATGVATVLVPVTLGLGVLTSGLLRFHSVLYGAGAVLLLVMGGLAATGRTWSLPFMRGSPDISRTDSAGVYALGVFSGAASACCAPVLAGVLTLSAVSPGLLASAGVGLTYVFGMVFPLVVITLIWDRVRPEGFNPGGRTVTWGIGSRRFTTTIAGAVTTVMFAVMAVVLAVVAATGSSLATPLQTRVGTGIEDFLAPVLDRLSGIPDLVVGLVLIAIAVSAVAISGRRRSPQPTGTEEGICHEHVESHPGHV
jgi:cytochrome c biogenesis protein CcdA